MNRSRVSIKIALMIGAVEVIAMLILYVIVDLNMTKTLEIQAIDDLNVIAGDRAALVEAYIRDCCSYVEGYSKSCEIRDVLENPEDAENIRQAREYTNNYAQDRKSMEGLYVARWDTYVLAHINPDSVDQTFRDEASALELKNMIISNDKPFCTGIVLAPVTKQMIIPVYAPVKDRNGEPIGFVGAAFYVESLNEELASLSINDVEGMEYALINAQTGVYIFDSRSDVAGETCTDPNIIKALDSLKTKAGGPIYSFTTRHAVHSCYYMTNRDWVFIVTAKASELFETVGVVRTGLLITCFIITAFMVLVCMALIEYNMKPIKAINDEIIKLNGKDFSPNYEIEVYSARTDEVGTIASAVCELRTVFESESELFKELLEVQNTGMLILKAEDEDIVQINDKALELFGIDSDRRNEVTIHEIRSRFDGDMNEYIGTELDKVRNSNDEVVFEERVNRTADTKAWLLAHGKGIKLSNGERVMIVSLNDITESKKTEENRQILSETDALTTLYNRRSGECRVNSVMAEGYPGMFCLFNVDKFKYVNDTFGHAVGDALLVRIAGVMRRTFRASDVLIRLGGDEFVVFATGVADHETGELVIGRFFEKIKELKIPELEEHRVTLSLGALFVDEATAFRDMYQKASEAMCNCKKKIGFAYEFYEE